MDPKLVKLLKSDATVLTPTRRLASRLISQANRHLSAQRQVWSTPCIFALDDWLKALWDHFEIQGVTQSLLLSSAQSLLLFENIIEQSEKGKVLLQTHTTAKLAYEAWKTLHFWEALPLLEKEPDNIDEAVFQQWAQNYRSWLAENQCIDGAQLIANCQSHIENTSSELLSCVSPQKKLVLYGFEEHSPLLNTFFQALTNLGWEIVELEPLAIQPSVLVRQAFINEEHECKAAAAWAKNLLAQNKRDIAIVTPHLTKQRHKIENIFRECFDALMICDSVFEINRDFNISAAIPLGQYPIIHAAFEFLKLSDDRCTLLDYLAALTSPFSANASSEAFARAKLSHHLRQQPLSKYSLEKAHATLTFAEVPGIEQWHNILSSLKQMASQLSGKKTLLQWSQLFRKILHFFAWPGERTLSSLEHQVVQRFDELLNELLYTDVVLAPMNYHTALQTLEKLAANIPFQAENKNAPVQLLGLLEAAGQHFEYLWVMGLHSDAWPENAQPNPFISIQYQRKHKMPHASPERERLYAQKVTQRLQASAQHIIFSYPLQDQEKSLTASELISALPLADPHFRQPLDMGAQHLFTLPTALVFYRDEMAPAVETQENITGNTNLVALQAACPFKAFAQIRLNIEPNDARKMWFSAREQGILMHRVLEAFWTTIQNSTALSTLANDQTEALLENLIDENIKSLHSDAPNTYLDVEKTRLKTLLKEYMILEKQRSPFKISALERQVNFSLGDLTFKLRIDRIDETENGDTIIIDYKTGQFSLNQLWGDRPQAPQLPLYYLALQQYQPKAIMITKLNSKQCEFIGLSYQSEDIQGLSTLPNIKNSLAPTEWEALHAYWQVNLENLVRNFQQGFAQVDPLQGKTTCQYCQLAPLCRIQELRVEHD